MLANKRIIKDIEILRKNREDLISRGIYVHVNENDMTCISLLIVPREKKGDGGLVSPYTFGNFMFQMRLGADFPMSPPVVEFYPKQNYCRLHPNYYEGGKVCLSVINTWSGNDWTPSTSLLTLINILEERLNENGICFEPSFVNASVGVREDYNRAVEYAKYKVCILEIKKCPLAKLFQAEIEEELNKNRAWLVARLKELKSRFGNMYQARTPCYGYTIKCNYEDHIKALGG